MLSKFAIADARSVPSAKADGSLKLPVPAVVAVEPVKAGVGVAGVVSDVGFVAAAGAAGGAAGVEVVACAGVDGGCAEDEAVEVLAGAVFGCLNVRWWTLGCVVEKLNLLNHTHYESLLLDLVGFNGVRILQNFA